MEIWQAVVLGVVEGLTEWLPVSSTGHLTVMEKLFGMRIDDPAVTGYTAVIQVGSIAAAFVYFRRDIARLAAVWARGVFSREARREQDYRFAWCVIAGSLPIGVVALVARDVIEGPLRNLWVVAVALIAWSPVMVLAERLGRRKLSEGDLTLRDALTVGAAQCLALIPGVSRSAATISVGLLRGYDRVTATRLAFFLAIPALTAAGVLQLPAALSESIGLVNVVAGMATSFVVGYIAIAWLLRFVGGHSLLPFVWYRLGLGALIMALLATGAITAT